MPYRVFVYGSLMRGFGNHGLLKTADFVGKGQVEGLRLHTLGPFPGVNYGDGVVQGEVYEVDEETLGRLDRLEGHPHFYRREPNSVFVHEMNGYLPCHLYIFQQPLGEDSLIESGDWRSYRDSLRKSP